MISQMVDQILLQEGQEVGYSSGDDDDLSGDEVKTPIFTIKRGENAVEESKDGDGMMEDDDEGDNSDEEAELFV